MRTPALRSFVTTAGAAVAMAMTGCSETTMQVQGCPNPVLLGPVDRIGGHRASPTKAVATAKLEVEDFASASSKTEHGVTTRTTSAASIGTEGVGLVLVEKTEGRRDRDVRVRKLPVGAWAWMLIGNAQSSAAANAWVGLEADVVEVSRGR